MGRGRYLAGPSLRCVRPGKDPMQPPAATTDLQDDVYLSPSLSQLCRVSVPTPANTPISYFEYITTLYRETSFDFSHGPGSVAFIPKHLPASHVALISQVNLDWELYHPLRLKAKKPGPQEVAWAGIWDGLEAMEGLEWLRVELRLAVPPDAPEWTGLEWTLWEAIRKVTRPSHFKLILPFPAAAETREETLPCKITRRVVQIPGLALN